VKSYAHSLTAFARGRLWWSLALLLSLNALEGVGIVMLLPLLAVAGVFGATDDVGGMGRQVVGMSEALGLPLTLPAVLAVFVGLVCAREGVARLQTKSLDDLVEGFMCFLREQLYRSVSQAQWLFLTRTRSSDVLHVLATDVSRIGSGTQHLLQTVSGGVMLIVYGLLAVWVSPAMTGLVVVIAGVVLVLLRDKIQLARLRGERTTQLGKRLYGVVSEHLGGMKLSKSFGAEQRNMDHFSKTVREVRAVASASRTDQANTKLWFAVGSVVIFSSFFYIAVDVFQVLGAELLMLLLIFSRTMPRVSRLLLGYQQVMHMLPAFTSFRELNARCMAEMEASTEDTPVPLPFIQEVRFCDVSFQYREGEEQVVLRGVNLLIGANQTTALVGPSGAGKSTLADLLMGLLTPGSGAINIDGQPLTGDDVRAWRQSIGYVPQDTFLFHDTVRANLCWVRPDVTEARIWEALAMAAAADFVRRLPNGLDTAIGERGIQLSGGERQRLALARALVAAPRLLILDEATSHLDAENERQIQMAIEHLHGRLTVVVIAHRLSTVRNADQIVVLDDGRVVETGSWDALHQRDSRFRQLVHAQGGVASTT
jgi:ATP-binding cassette subfamily C protein